MVPYKQFINLSLIDFNRNKVCRSLTALGWPSASGFSSLVEKPHFCFSLTHAFWTLVKLSHLPLKWKSEWKCTCNVMILFSHTSPSPETAYSLVHHHPFTANEVRWVRCSIFGLQYLRFYVIKWCYSKALGVL